MDTISRRNTDTFEQALKKVTDKMFEQQKAIDGLMSTVSNLTVKINEVELKYNMQQAKSFGTGPSVRES